MRNDQALSSYLATLTTESAYFDEVNIELADGRRSLHKLDRACCKFYIHLKGFWQKIAESLLTRVIFKMINFYADSVQNRVSGELRFRLVLSDHNVMFIASVHIVETIQVKTALIG